MTCCCLATRASIPSRPASTASTPRAISLPIASYHTSARCCARCSARSTTRSGGCARPRAGAQTAGTWWLRPGCEARLHDVCARDHSAIIARPACSCACCERRARRRSGPRAEKLKNEGNRQTHTHTTFPIEFVHPPKNEQKRHTHARRSPSSCRAAPRYVCGHGSKSIAATAPFAGASTGHDATTSFAVPSSAAATRGFSCVISAVHGRNNLPHHFCAPPHLQKAGA